MDQDKLKLIIKTALETNAIKYQSYDINLGICYKDGFYIFSKQTKYNYCKKGILFIEKGNTVVNNNYLYFNNYLYSFEENNYYIFDELSYGISCVNKGYIVFMELIPI